METAIDKTESALMEELCATGSARQAGGNDRCSQLQTLVCELLVENQRLRGENEKLLVRVAELEQRAKQSERGLADAARWTGALL